LDNAGTAGNFGNGLSAAPHNAQLTTSTINLANDPNVVLQFEQYYRRFAGPGGSQAVTGTYIEFSTDGGTTFGNRIAVNSNIAVNAATANPNQVKLNVSSIIGGQSNVKIRFIFDGDYYVWMVDDIEIVEVPSHELQFTAFSGAPAHDILFRNLTGSNPKYGHMSKKQCRDIYFDANAYNFGNSTQTNVRLEIDILDATNNVVFTTTTPSAPSLITGDTLSFATLTTSTPWQTCNAPEGEYRVIYKMASDSIPAAAGSIQPIDTFVVRITDSINALNFGDVISNTIGTNTNFGEDAVQFASSFELTNSERAFGSWAWVSVNSVPGALINVYVYDSTGFAFATGFPNPPLIVVSHTLTQADIDARRIQFDFTDANGVPLYLSTGGYYIGYEFFSNTSATPVFIGNNATFPQPGRSSIFYITRAGVTPSWITGFNNSNTFTAPIIRMITCPEAQAAACMTISVDEVKVNEAINVYPNPTSGLLNLEFDNAKGGYNATLVNTNGQVVYSKGFHASVNHVETFDFTSMAAGLYMLQVRSDDGRMSTYKVNIQ